MALSLLATILEGNILSLDELPSSITNCRKLALSGALWLKVHFPKDAANVFIRWKSLFTELRSTLISLGLGDCYREAFQTIEEKASKGDESVRHQVRSKFLEQERQFFCKFSLPAVKALYDHDYDSVAQALQKSDMAIDYTFKIYNPEHHNPPQNQACVVVISPEKPPVITSISDKLIYGLLQKWPQAIYKSWQSQNKEFEEVSKSLSDVLFPEEVRKILLGPSVTRVFISPDSDLMCFPIDQLPLIDDEDGSILPLYERVSVSILSSPRELLRQATVKKLRDETDVSSGGTSDNTCSQDIGKMDHAATLVGADSEQASNRDPSQTGKTQPKSENSSEKGDAAVQPSTHIGGNPAAAVFDAGHELAETVANMQLSNTEHECFVVANPDYRLESTDQPISSWKSWLGSFSALLGSTVKSESRTIKELQGTQREAESVCRLLSMNRSFKVHPPLTQKEATISSVLSLKSPHILHLATHGYTSKQESTPYYGNFWNDESSGILLAGAQTYLDKKFKKMDIKAGTGHMNSIAMCGMQLEGTRLVFVSACDSSVGSRPSQEMPASITHALRAAGAQTVISTLWIVSDSEATDFVSSFYEHLVTHPDCRPSEALSYAKAVMKQKGHSMFHWGAYVCHGLDYPLL